MVALAVPNDAESTVLEAMHAVEALPPRPARAGAIRVLFTDVHTLGAIDGLVLAHPRGEALGRRWPGVCGNVMDGGKVVG